MEEMLTAIGAGASAAWARLQPTPPAEAPGASTWWVLGAVAAAVAIPPLWRRLRVLVTVVHELGHGLVGILCGRRFTGLVLREDMSGHAVTVGPARGAGRVLSTWAGYPAPALAGAALVRAAGWGWSAPVLGALAVVLLGALLRVRSFFTAVVMVAVTVCTAALWWWGGPAEQGVVLLGLGLFLLVGAWRHLGALLTGPSATSDVAILARLTRVPRWCWSLSFAVVLAGAGWLSLWPLAALLGL